MSSLLNQRSLSAAFMRHGFNGLSGTHATRVVDTDSATRPRKPGEQRAPSFVLSPEEINNFETILTELVTAREQIATMKNRISQLKKVVQAHEEHVVEWLDAHNKKSIDVGRFKVKNTTKTRTTKLTKEDKHDRMLEIIANDSLSPEQKTSELERLRGEQEQLNTLEVIEFGRR